MPAFRPGAMNQKAHPPPCKGMVVSKVVPSKSLMVPVAVAEVADTTQTVTLVAPGKVNCVFASCRWIDRSTAGAIFRSSVAVPAR